MNSNRELWNEYRRTWEAFAAALDKWQSGAPEVEQARAAHAAARDRLAEELSPHALVSGAAA